MVARELLCHLTYLQLSGYEGDGEYQWLGTKDDWTKVMWALDGVPSYDPYYKQPFEE